MTVTIRDVAKAAGVSVTTVSRALNGHSDVSQTTREKVLETASQLSFRPSQVARNLVMNRTQTVGLLISDFNKDLGGQHFLFDVLAGIHDRLASDGYDVTLVSTSTTQQQLLSYLDFCIERRFSGVIVMGMRLDDPYVHEVVEAPLPSVVVDLPLLSQHCGYVMTDNVNGARFAVKHLVSRGHRKIGFVNGHGMAAVSVERRRGYEDGMRSMNLPVDPSWVYESDFTMEGGTTGLTALLDVHPDITGVFFASDLMAIGGLQFARSRGLRVPDDIALVGFDNIDLGAFVTPPLTTVSQPRHDMGATAAEMLLNMMHHHAAPEGRMLSPTLVVRETT